MRVPFPDFTYCPCWEHASEGSKSAPFENGALFIIFQESCLNRASFPEYSGFRRNGMTVLLFPAARKEEKKGHGTEPFRAVISYGFDWIYLQCVQQLGNRME